MNRHARFIEALEARQLLSITPAGAPLPPATSPSAVRLSALTQPLPSDLLSKAVRQDLLNHWNGANKSELQGKLDAGKMGAFDSLLLGYMQSRPGQTFYFNPADIAASVSYIKTWMNTAPTVVSADDILAHRFPEQGNSDTYTVQLPSGVINWSTQPAATSNPEFIPNLNRMGFWLDLAQAYRFNNNTAYVSELINQLASWSQQNSALADPNTWSSNSPHWALLDTSIRADSWCWAYQLLVTSPAWTPDANTLFLYKLYQHGDFLRRVTPYDLSSNRSLFQAQGLLDIAQLLPELDSTGDWKAYAHQCLFGAMDAQLYADGGHVEQSPGYTANIIDSLLETYWLDQQMGDASLWSSARGTKLINAMNAYIQLLSPNGALPALSDTYRSTSLQMLTKARLVLNTNLWPTNKPRIRDVWLFGSSAVNPYIGSPVSPTLGNRGTAFGMSDSGYYVARSGSDANARQLTFDAGPTGGVHGHFDLLNFELFGYGRALISDPGVYKYDSSDPNRTYVISTRAHNTLNVDGASHAALEGAHNASIVVDQFTTDSSHTQFTAHHFGYAALAGSPVISRSIWYDNNGTMLIVDWAEATSSHSYQVSFNLPVDPTDAASVTGVQPDGSFRSRWTTGGNVQVSPLLLAGQTAARNALTFVSNSAPPNESSPAYRFTLTGSGKTQIFATLVTSYIGTSPPNITASWVTATPNTGQPLVLRLNNNGSTQDITFTPPDLDRPPANFASPNGSANGLAWDSAGRLHMSFFDRTSRSLKYSVRDSAGNWSIIQTIDPNTDCGVYQSLALDSSGIPGVAYFDGNNGDLKYAKLVNGAWQTQTVDSATSVGLYPSLVFSRNDGPVISYYHRTKGDLRLATASYSGWTISTIDSAGDVGRCSSLNLDPNRPEASKFAVAYEDTSHGHYKYAIQYKTTWAVSFVDTATTIGGGYTSLAFQNYKSSDGTYRPTVSYYDAGNSALKFAAYSGTSWSSQTVASAGKQGLYTTLLYEPNGVPNIFYFDKTNNRAFRARKGKTWAISLLGAGGREMHAVRHPAGTIAYSGLDEAFPRLDVKFLGS